MLRMKWTQTLSSKLFYGLYYFFLGCEHLFAKWMKRKSSKPLNALRNTFLVVKRFVREPFFPTWGTFIPKTLTTQSMHQHGVWAGLEYAADSTRVILYVHGGTYTHGQVDHFVPYVDQLAYKLNCPVFILSYGQAPKTTLDEMLDSLQRATSQLVRQFPTQELYLLGDGAGGGLCFRLMNRYTWTNQPIPFRKCAVYSPFYNLSCDGLSMSLNRSIDARNHTQVLQSCASKVIIQPMRDTWRLEWTTFPPCRIVVSDDEILFDDSVRIYYFLHQSILTLYQNLFHGFQHFWERIPEALDEFHRLDEFLRLDEFI
jgi:monoterpene epsilon-lactone hydrolase